ncbi:MAG: cysteine desulfurase family protein [Bdellovibrionales bacterium]
MSFIYLDYNATAPIRPECITAMSDVMQTAHNASAVHYAGREGRKIVENARETIAKLVKLPPSQIIFNSGATEGNNTVLNAFEKEYPNELILVSSIEHPSVLETETKTQTIPVTKHGIIDLNALETLLTDNKISLVSTMMVNNETGIIQPIKDIADLTHKHGALLHVDAVQAAGRIAINAAELEIDFLTLSAHKIGGPQGIGALCMRLCGITPTLLHGGGQEKSARAGTENVAGITGFATATDLAIKELENYQSRLSKLQSTLENGLSKFPNVKIYGQDQNRVCNTTLISISGLSSETLLMNFDLDRIAISNGSACSSGKVEPSHVLKAMKENDNNAKGALRISMGWNTSEDDITTFLDSFAKIYARMESKIIV